MMCEDDVVNYLVGTPYLDLGRSISGLDCYGVVVLVTQMMNWPVPFDPMIPPDSALKIARAFRRYSTDWMKSSRVSGAVGLVGGNSPHHAGIFISNGILHTTRESGVIHVPENDLRFNKADWFKWQ